MDKFTQAILQLIQATESPLLKLFLGVPYVTCYASTHDRKCLTTHLFDLFRKTCGPSEKTIFEPDTLNTYPRTRRRPLSHPKPNRSLSMQMG